MSEEAAAATRKPRTRFDAPLAAWFAARGWTPAAFQREAWKRYLAGESGLLVTPTGSGKTLAAFGGPLLEAITLGDTGPIRRKRGETRMPRTRILWITPLRALANDTARALHEAISALQVPWTVAMRTGDASSRDKRLARQGQAEVLVITPESLALLLSYPDTQAQLAGLRCVIVDEWHELLGNKRGVLLQLCLARLRAIASPALRIWGLSATLGNLPQARDVLLPHRPDAVILDAAKPRSLRLRTLLPETGERFPWAGHLGLSHLQRVCQAIAQTRTTLLFANTRAQAELWHRALATRLLAVQQLQAGDTVGYGSRFTAEGPMTIGVAACGYADGYPRHCDTGTPVLVNGVRTRLVGRVSMDMVTVDLTPLQQAGVEVGFGSEVTLWGRSNHQGTVLPIDEVAQAAGTVGYELMCALAPRVPVAVDAPV